MAAWKVYGLKNCDTCRKTRKWLAAEGVAHDFVDVRADGVEAADIERWAAAVGWESLINRRGATWRGLSEQDRAAALGGEGAPGLVAAQPALVKRPVFENGPRVLVGFTDAVKAEVKG